MPLHASIVGTRLEAVEVMLTPRMSLAYAAAIDDDAPHETRALIASPFQCVSLEWQSVVDGARDRLGVTPPEMARVVHAGQRSAFLEPLRSGRRYRVEPVIVGARNIRAGALVETMSEIVDVGDGKVVVRTLSSAIYRGTMLSGADEAAPPAAATGREAEELSNTLPLPISRWLPHIYTECADIWNPIHTEPDAARAAGLPDIIVHGTALWALSGQALARRFADGDSSRIAELGGRFAGMVFPGRPLTLRHGQIDTLGSLPFELVDEGGRAVLAEGRLTFRR